MGSIKRWLQTLTLSLEYHSVLIYDGDYITIHPSYLYTTCTCIHAFHHRPWASLVIAKTPLCTVLSPVSLTSVCKQYQTWQASLAHFTPAYTLPSWYDSWTNTGVTTLPIRPYLVNIFIADRAGRYHDLNGCFHACLVLTGSADVTTLTGT